MVARELSRREAVSMKLSVRPMTLNLRTTFRVSHGASDQRHNVLVCLDHEGLTGYGEAAAVFYYGETQESLMAYLESIPLLGEDPFALENVLNSLPDGPQAGRAAVDIALHDLWGKLLGQPLYRLFGLASSPLPQTSFTISIDAPEVMAQRAKESQYPIIKIKLDAHAPEAQVAAIRQVTDARLRVDANAAWTPEQALEIITRLAPYELEMVEQPLSSEEPEPYIWLHNQLWSRGVTTPIFADESVKTAQDVARFAGAVDGVVVKLMKSGGLRETLRAIHTARAHEMQIMLSCMIESSVGVTAAAHLAPLCDYLDLDGPLLIANDPFTGIRYEGASLFIPDGPGIGILPSNS
jgi:L-alanine-DL-glutamate epimerase-like enolase superfamily enzyme